MAQLQNTSITGSLEFNTGGFFKLGTTPDTGSAENMWFDTVNNVVKISCTGANPSSWSTGGALITARELGAGAGTQNAGLAFGGRTPTIESCTEEYNGTSWTDGGSMNVAMSALSGAGTQAEGLAFTGNVGAPSFARVACTEEYNEGSTFITTGSLTIT